MFNLKLYLIVIKLFFVVFLFSNVELFIMTLAKTVVPDEMFAIHGQIYSVMRGSRSPKNHKATKPAFNVGQSSARQR